MPLIDLRSGRRAGATRPFSGQMSVRLEVALLLLIQSRCSPDRRAQVNADPRRWTRRIVPVWPSLAPTLGPGQLHSTGSVQQSHA